MTVKRSTLPNTGIYQHRSVELEVRSPSDLAKLPDLLSKAEDLTALLSRLESEARQVMENWVGRLSSRDRATVESAGIDYLVEIIVLPKTRKRLDRAFRQPHGKERERQLRKELIEAERASDASRVLHLVEIIRSQLKAGSYDSLVPSAIYLGMACERLKVRRFESATHLGRTLLPKFRKGGRRRNKDLLQEFARIAADFRASGKTYRGFIRSRGMSLGKLQRALRATPT